MIGEIYTSTKTILDLFWHSLSSERAVKPADRRLEFSTPGIVSRWELSCVSNTEENVYEQMVDEFQQGDVFFDIGANIGFYTCLFSTKASKVYSFEPNPEAVDLLEENIENNSLGNVEVEKLALSSENGYRSMDKVPGATALGMASISEEAGDTPVRTADSLLKDEEIELPDMVKIDVEGHECRVLRGMRNIIERAKPVLYVESHDTEDGLEDILEKHGYQYEVVDHRIEGNKFYRATVEE